MACSTIPGTEAATITRSAPRWSVSRRTSASTVGIARIPSFQCATPRESSRRAAMVSVADNRGAGALQQHGEHQTDGSLTDHHSCFVRLRRALHHGLQTGIHGLDETGAIKRDSVRNLFHAVFDDPIHNAHVLRKTAAGRFKSRGHADLFVDRALRVQFTLAIETFRQGMWWKTTTRSPGAKRRTWLPSAHYNPGSLMSIDAWGGQKVVFDFLKVGMADSASFDANQHLAGTDFGNGDLLHRDDTLAFVHSRVHGRRDTPVRIGNRQ